MPAFTVAERRFAEAIARLSHSNPFLPERIDAERDALGDDFDEQHADWNLTPDAQYDHPNVDRLIERSAAVLRESFARLSGGQEFAAGEQDLYVDLLLFVVFHHHRRTLDRLMLGERSTGATGQPRAAYRALANEAREFLTIRGQELPAVKDLPHAFACFFQIRRAYKNIFDFIIGVSRPAMRLRATVWESIFTHDMRRYRRRLYREMGDFTTLITGPSGTGKELVARAVGLSRYIPFDPRAGQFTADFAGSFYAVNLSAFSPTLIESELFGHRRGSFTGAIADRAGWLEVCPALGTVFLDEIGEVDPAIQVKLLRVLQTREFSRLGDTETRRFQGKLIAATNRDLAAELRQGGFRQDLYYRLCSDVIHVPTLRERLADTPQELAHLVHHMASRLVGDEAEDVVDETLTAIEQHLGPAYPWPGNVRELEQCVRNVLVRREYRPHQAPLGTRQLDDGAGTGDATPTSDPSEPADPHRQLAAQILQGALTAEELLRAYCTIMYAECGSFERAAERLKLDRRTVSARVDEALLARLSRHGRS
jgi:DNA-binding NtrC family response regulator